MVCLAPQHLQASAASAPGATKARGENPGLENFLPFAVFRSCRLKGLFQQLLGKVRLVSLAVVWLVSP